MNYAPTFNIKTSGFQHEVLTKANKPPFSYDIRTFLTKQSQALNTWNHNILKYAISIVWLITASGILLIHSSKTGFREKGGVNIIVLSY